MKYGGPEKPWAWDGRGSFLLSYLLAAAALGAHRETVLQSWTNLTCRHTVWPLLSLSTAQVVTPQ